MTVCFPLVSVRRQHKLIANEDYGKMVALKGTEIIGVPLSEIAGKLKGVPVDCEEIRSARDLGISFGD